MGNKLIHKIWLKSLALIISLLTTLFLFPLLAILFTPIYIFRLIVIKLAKYFRPDLAQILATRSTNPSIDKWYEPNPVFMIAIVKTFEGRIKPEDISKTIENRIFTYKLPNGQLRFPEMKQYPVDFMGFRFWKKDENFCIKNHVKYYSKNNDNEEIFTQTDLKKLEQEALAMPLARDRSPWELLLVNNYYPDGNSKEHTIVVSRIHHSIGDGYSLIKLLIEGLFGLEVPKQSQNSVERNVKKKSILFYLMFPFKAVFEFSEGILKLLKYSPLTVPVSKRTQCSVAVSNKINLESLKKFKSEMDVSLSSVVMSACAGGLKKIMEKKDMQIPDGIQCWLPFPLPGRQDKLRNHLTHVFIDLPMASVKTQEDRIKILNETYKNLMGSTSPAVNAFLTKAVGGLFTPLAELFATTLVPSVLISNLPADFSHLHFEGHREVDQIGYSGLCNLPAISFFVSSFSGYMRITVVAERALLTLEETDQLANQVENELLSYLEHHED